MDAYDPGSRNFAFAPRRLAVPAIEEGEQSDARCQREPGFARIELPDEGEARLACGARRPDLPRIGEGHSTEARPRAREGVRVVERRQRELPRRPQPGSEEFEEAHFANAGARSSPRDSRNASRS